VCVCVCVCIKMCTYIYTHTIVYTHTHAHTYIYTYINIYIYIHTLCMQAPHLSEHHRKLTRSIGHTINHPRSLLRFFRTKLRIHLEIMKYPRTTLSRPVQLHPHMWVIYTILCMQMYVSSVRKCTIINWLSCTHGLTLRFPHGLFWHPHTKVNPVSAKCKLPFSSE